MTRASLPRRLIDHEAQAPFYGPGHFGLCEGCGDVRVNEPHLEPELRSQPRGDDVVTFHYDSLTLREYTAAHFALGWDDDGWPHVKWGAWAPCTFNPDNTEIGKGYCDPAYRSEMCPYRGKTYLEALDVRADPDVQARLDQ